MDAATPPATVAVVRGNDLLAVREGPFGPKTDAWIHVAVDEVLREAGLRLAELDCIAAGQGPGTFTGIRVALAAALGLSAGSGVPACGISTLLALLESAQADEGRVDGLDVAALIDARREQHYVLRAHAAGSPIVVEGIWGPAAVRTTDIEARFADSPPAVVVGAPVNLPEGVRCVESGPLAVSIARIAARLEAEHRPAPVPSYLRPPDAVPAVSPLRQRPL